MPQPHRSANADLKILAGDVSKRTVMLRDGPNGRPQSVANTVPALCQALRPFASHDWLVCETTGGWERPLLEAAAIVGLKACREDASRVKAFIVSHGGRAKTDGIDAGWLVRYGLERAASLKVWSPPSPQRQAFTELMRHRQDLLTQRVQAKNRRSAPCGPAVQALLDEQIAFLSSQIKRVDHDMAALIDACPDLAQDEQCLRAIPGIGAVVARTLLALLPELGSFGPKQVASLAGLAPHPKDSGQSSGYRRTGPGRGGLRPILFMAALSASRRHPQLADVYQRLLKAGKPKRLALTAIARKLLVIANGVLRDHRATQLQLT
jgi:transposase